jgi:predicted DCC family thiol-disulfide oxidoreductase YuxK
LIVLFDGGCPMCRRTVKWLRAIDWLRGLQFVDAMNADARHRIAPGLTEEAVLVEMYVVDEKGKRSGGFDGYLEIAKVVPLLWPMGLVGRLPGLRQAGAAIYRTIAANRIRRGRCTDELCAPVAPRRGV